MTNIVISIPHGEAALKASKNVIEKLNYMYPGAVKVLHDGQVIHLGDTIRIDFKYEAYYNLAGLWPDYFYAETEEAIGMLQQDALKCGGRRLHNLGQVIQVASYIYMHTYALNEMLEE